ncbi:MAG: hypothetical protein RID91_15965, partial [Azospirillaceae bacterium]
MTGVLDRLLDRAAGAEPEVRARLRGRFQPAAAAEDAPPAGAEPPPRPATPETPAPVAARPASA